MEPKRYWFCTNRTKPPADPVPADLRLDQIEERLRKLETIKAGMIRKLIQMIHLATADRD